MTVHVGRRGPRPTLLVVTAFLAMAVSLTFEAASEFILVPVADEFSLSVDGLNYLAVVPTVASLISIFLAGALAVRYGRRAVLMGSAAIMCAGAALMSLATSLPVMFAGRVLCGVGGVPLTVVGLSLVNVTFSDPARRAKMFGLMAALTPVVYILAPVAGTLITASIGWRFVPTLWLVAAAVTFFLARISIGAGDPPSSPTELVTPVLGGLALALACLAISLAGLGFVMWAIAIGIVAAMVMGAVAMALRRSDRPSLDLRVFRTPGALLAAGAIIFSFALDISYFVNLYIQLRYQLPLPYLALLAILPELAGIAGSLTFGWLASRWGPGRSALVALTAAAILPLCVFLLGPDSLVWVIVVLCMVVNFPIAGSVGPLTEYFLNGAPEDGSDAASATVDALTNVRTVLLAAVIGIVAFAGFQQALSNGLMKGGVPAQAAAAAAAEIRGGVSSADFALTLQDPNDPLRRALSEEATTMEDAQFAALRLTALIMTIGGGLGAGMLGISIRRSSAASARRRSVSET